MHSSRGERQEGSIGGEDFLQQDDSPFGHQAFSLLHFWWGGRVSLSAEEEKSCKMSGFLCVLRGFIFLFTPCSSSFVSPTYSTELLQRQGFSCSLALWAGSLGAGHNLSLTAAAQGTALSSQLWCLRDTECALGEGAEGAWSPGSSLSPVSCCVLAQVPFQGPVTPSARWRQEQGLLHGAVARIR